MKASEPVNGKALGDTAVSTVVDVDGSGEPRSTIGTKLVEVVLVDAVEPASTTVLGVLDVLELLEEDELGSVVEVVDSVVEVVDSVVEVVDSVLDEDDELDEEDDELEDEDEELDEELDEDELVVET
jgi:hypothetical protein